MKRIVCIILILVAFAANSQTDTIFTKKNGDIICKITKKTSMNLFYSELGVGKSIPLAEVKRTSDISQLDKPQDKQAEPEKAEPKKDKDASKKYNEPDTIYSKAGAVIFCKITKKTDLSYFYTEKGVGKTIDVGDVAKTSNIQELLDSYKPKTPRPKMPEDCKVSKKNDKADNSTNYFVEFANWGKFTKKIIGRDTSYYANLWAEGKTQDNYRKGVVITFGDGTKITRPDVEVTCKPGSGDMFDYTVYFKLNPEDVQTILKKAPLAFKLYNANRAVGEKMGSQMKQGLSCLTYAP